MNNEQTQRYTNLMNMALDYFSDPWNRPTEAEIRLAEGYTAQALALLRIEIKAAEATK